MRVLCESGGEGAELQFAFPLVGSFDRSDNFRFGVSVFFVLEVSRGSSLLIERVRVTQDDSFSSLIHDILKEGF